MVTAPWRSAPGRRRRRAGPRCLAQGLAGLQHAQVVVGRGLLAHGHPVGDHRVIVSQAHLTQAFLVRARYASTALIMPWPLAFVASAASGKGKHDWAPRVARTSPQARTACATSVHLVPEERFRQGQAQPVRALAYAGEDVFMRRRAACGPIQRIRTPHRLVDQRGVLHRAREWPDGIKRPTEGKHRHDSPGLPWPSSPRCHTAPRESGRTPVSVPNATGTRWLPPPRQSHCLTPRTCGVACHGLCGVPWWWFTPGAPKANCTVLAFPNNTIPTCVRRRT